MITAKEIRHALKVLVSEKAQLPYAVYFNHVEKSDKSYIWIDLTPTKSSIDTAYFQWSINVDIKVILFPNEYAAIEHDDLWAISDKLTAAVMPCVEIETEDLDKSKTRYITVQNFKSYIVDDILHYEFSLDFTDYVRSDEYEKLEYNFMENLEMQFDDWVLKDERESLSPSSVIKTLFEEGSYD